MQAGRFVFVSALLCSAVAVAQTYAVTSTSAPYAALQSPTVVALTPSMGCTTAADCGYAVIPLGFDFPFYGQTYASVTVTADGMAYFEPNPGSAVYPTNTVLPSGVAPQGVLAPFWDNLEGSNAFSRLAYQATTNASGKVLTIEWAHWNHWSSTATYDLNFQLRLHEDGLIEFHYGPTSGAGQVLTATIGIEDPTGAQGLMAKSCGATCASTDLVPNELLTFGPGANTVDLIAGALVIDQVIDNGGTLSITTELGVSNFGSLPANNVDYALYLSSDTVLDGSDTPFTPATQGPLSLPARGKTTDTATSTVPKPTGGAWYVLAALDPSNAITETSETNNVASTAKALVTGVDLVADAISADVSAGGPGDPVTTTLSFTNAGLDPSGAFDAKVHLSTDTTLDPGDPIVGTTGSISLAGGQSVTVPLTWTVPTNVPKGTYWLVLELDHANAVPETSETNNVVFSQLQFAVSQPDLVVTNVTMTDPQPPYGPAAAYYFGQPFRAEVSVTNQGAVTAKAYDLGVAISANESFSLLVDEILSDLPNQTLPGGASTTVIVTGTLPAPGGAKYKPGFYWFFGDASLGADPTPTNNINLSAPQLILDPAPNLVPTGVFVSPELAGGETFAVARVLRNLGYLNAPAAAYRYFLSKNSDVTPQDIPLEVQQPDGSFGDELEVTLPAGASDSRTDWIRLPDGIVPGDYYLGVAIDPANAIAETDELDNGAASQPVTVVAPRFRISDAPLVDALVGVPYATQLVTLGEVGTVTWSLQSAPESLPEDVTLTPDGRLTGTASTTGLWAFTAQATDTAGRTATGAFVLRVLPQTGTVTITSTRLPPPVVSVPYRASLSAQGGATPYHWTVIDGALFDGLTLSDDGEASGVTTLDVGTTTYFTAQVIDAVGNASTERYQLTVVGPGSLFLETDSFPEAQVGADFALDVTAKNANGDPVAAPLEWTLRSGRLPAGLAFEESPPNAWILRGTPRESGAFSLKVGVTDAVGNDATETLILEVHPSVATIGTDLPQYVLRGTDVSARFSFGGGVGGTFALDSGGLPPGLTLNADGTIVGHIPDDAPFAITTFTVKGRADTGEDGLAIASVEVVSTLPKAAPTGCGCDTNAGAPQTLSALALLLFAAMSRRRSPTA